LLCLGFRLIYPYNSNRIAIANPHPEKPCYGLISTGGSFTFIKLVKNGNWKYANSKVFELRNPGNDLHQVLRILKHLSQIALN
jgi:hypothetical protein